MGGGQAFRGIELRGLRKAYGACVANEDISLRASSGTIHAIVGENGAGKSTAMKMLYGMIVPDKGEISVDGTVWGRIGKRWRSPLDAIACGIGMVHQHFMLAGPETALENVVLGAETSVPRWKWLPPSLRPMDLEGARAKLEVISKKHGFAIDWDARIDDLPVGVQQRIEIVKLLYRDARVLILDEPTAVLTPQETQELFVQLKQLAAEGRTILIITHKLKEVMALADRVTVFRAGRIAGEAEVRDTSPDQLATWMVGRKVSLQVQAPPQPVLGAPVLEMQNLSLRNRATGLPALQDVSLQIRAGEILGIAGIEGNGQSEILQLLQHPASYRGLSSGTIRILGNEVHGEKARWTAAKIKALGVGVIPEDRHREGLLLDRDLRENFFLGLQRTGGFTRHGWIRWSALTESAQQAVEKYDVRPRDIGALVRGLSGGNQQKLIIARELGRAPQFLIAAQPTRGVDVGAIELIHRRIFEARDAGAAVLLVSSELDEVRALSDRIAVMYGGRVVASFARGEATESQLGLYMGGGSV